MFDWKFIEAEKETRRSRVASLSFAEKLLTLERLRERGLQFRKLRGDTRSAGPVASTMQISVLHPSDQSVGSISLIMFGADPGLLAAFSAAEPTTSVTHARIPNAETISVFP